MPDATRTPFGGVLSTFSAAVEIDLEAGVTYWLSVYSVNPQRFAWVWEVDTTNGNVHTRSGVGSSYEGPSFPHRADFQLIGAQVAEPQALILLAGGLGWLALWATVRQ